jgi:8-amino-7-oxononanoate synthase
MVPEVLGSLRDEMAAELRALEDRGRLRDCTPMAGPTRVAPTSAGTRLISFSSNDYLGLASHPALATAAAGATARSGFGASASRLVSGDLPEHRDLEAALAGFVGLPAALLFPTGYQANLGVVPTLATRGDLILSDQLNHASLIDACRLSRADVVPYPHCDTTFVAETLAATTGRHRRRLLLTESLFSMDGDVAPLAELALLAERHRAVLVVDEAHALGVMGPGGKGLCAAAGVVPDALVGTLGKAFGASGGVVAGAPELRQLLINRARTFIFTTAPPPSAAAAAGAALAVAAGSEGDRCRAVLFDHINQLAAQLRADVFPRGLLQPRPSPIIPIVFGPDRAATDASRALRAAGFLVQAIRPPTVPEGTARLRITLSAGHDPSAISGLAQALAPLLPR